MCRAIGADATQGRGLSSKWRAFNDCCANPPGSRLHTDDHHPVSTQLTSSQYSIVPISKRKTKLIAKPKMYGKIGEFTIQMTERGDRVLIILVLRVTSGYNQRNILMQQSYRAVHLQTKVNYRFRAKGAEFNQRR